MKKLIFLLLIVPHICFGASDFTIIAVPDTQYWSNTVFQSMGSWISTNRTSLNIQAVLGLGDVTDVASDLNQWKNSTNLYYQLPSDLLSTPICGNHDYQDYNSRNLSNYNVFYGQGFYTNQTWWTTNGGAFLTNGASENFYARKVVGGNPWLIFGLEFGPRDVVLTWVSNVCVAFPSDKVVITQHEFTHANTYPSGLQPEDTTWDPHGYILTGCNDGIECWNKCYRFIPNLFLILNGHYPDVSDASQLERRILYGDSGNAVNCLLADYQWWPNLEQNGGWIRIMTFHPGNNTCNVTTYRTTDGATLTTAPHQFSFNVFDSFKPTIAASSIVSEPIAAPFTLGDPAFMGSLPSSLKRGLVSYWKMEEASNTSRNDVNGTNNLASVNNVPQATGKINYGAQVTGTSSQHLSATSSASLNFGTSPFTMAGWVLLTVTNTGNVGFFGKYNSSVNKRQYEIFCSSMVPALKCSADGIGGTQVNASTNAGALSITLTTNVWYFVAGWWDGSSGVSIQVNNGEVTTASGFAGPIFSSDSTFDVGSFASANYSTALFDEIGLWNRVLTASERTQLYRAGAGTTWPRFR